MGLGYHAPGSANDAKEIEQQLDEINNALVVLGERLAEIRDRQNSVVVLLDQDEPPLEP